MGLHLQSLARQARASATDGADDVATHTTPDELCRLLGFEEARYLGRSRQRRREWRAAWTNEKKDAGSLRP